MPSLEAASNATDITNILFIGTLLACIVWSVAVAWFVNRRDGIDSPEGRDTMVCTMDGIPEVLEPVRCQGRVDRRTGVSAETTRPPPASRASEVMTVSISASL